MPLVNVWRQHKFSNFEENAIRCHQEKRKTINGEDILYAMQSLGFDNYVDPLKIYLQKYRESMKGEKSLVLGDGDLLLVGSEKPDTNIARSPTPSTANKDDQEQSNLSSFFSPNDSQFAID